jgi:hypothetical protein
MPQTRQIKGREFINDLRMGKTPAELMEKHGLTVTGLRKVFRLLLEASAMRKADIESISSLYELEDDDNALRREPRKKILFPLFIYDGIEQMDAGRVVDISAKGVRVKGLRAVEGEIKTFIVRFGPGSVSQRPFVFDAKCRWVDNRKKNPKELEAGYEITNISSLDAQALEELLKE